MAPNSLDLYLSATNINKGIRALRVVMKRPSGSMWRGNWTRLLMSAQYEETMSSMWDTSRSGLYCRSRERNTTMLDILGPVCRRQSVCQLIAFGLLNRYRTLCYLCIHFCISCLNSEWILHTKRHEKLMTSHAVATWQQCLWSTALHLV